jgi:hypothetical protein
MMKDLLVDETGIQAAFDEIFDQAIAGSELPHQINVRVPPLAPRSHSASLGSRNG